MSVPSRSLWDVAKSVSLRELRVIITVSEQGSMAKAAALLGVTQSAVSQIVSTVEDQLGVRLFDRSRRGVEPTLYGTTLLNRSRAAFDELRSGLIEIDELVNAGTGEIRIGCPETLAASILPVAINAFTQRWPNITVEVDTFYGEQTGEKLKDRHVDLVLARGGDQLNALRSTDEFDIVSVLKDRLVIVVGENSAWKDLGPQDLGLLQGAPWITLPYGWGEKAIPDAFRRIGMEPPSSAIRTFSVHLRVQLVVTGRFITALPESILRQYEDHFAIKSLPIDIPNDPYDVAIVAVRNRTQRRAVELFMETTAELLRTW